MTRLGKILALMAREQVDCLIIKDEMTIRYLTGFSGDSSLFFLDEKKGVLLTDGRYTEQASKEIKLFKVQEHSGDIWAAAAQLVCDGKHFLAGFDGDSYSYTDYKLLRYLLPLNVSLRSVDFSTLRMVKDKTELELLEKAAQISDEAFLRLLPDIRPGLKEKTLAARLEYHMRALGSEKSSFDTIVASGWRSALPHGIASDKEVANGEFITFDFGAVWQGYHADVTRTVMLGAANQWQQEIYAIVEEAQSRGLKAAREGMTGKELDAIVRASIESRGYGACFVHGTGHGVGLEIHELPFINKAGEIVLKTGMVFTIEPGIYVPGNGGVRIEDSVYLTETGARPLNKVKKQLIEIY